MKKILFLLVVLFSVASAFAQFGRPDNAPQFGTPGVPRIFSEIHSVPVDSGCVIYYCYRIPYNFLIFEKSGSGFKAGFTLGLEITDSLTKSIQRANTDKDITVSDFETTTSMKDFVEGVLEVKVEKGKYNISPYFTDKSSVKEFKLRPHTVTTSGNTILNPVVIEENPVVCNQSQKIILANYNGDIPFSETPYSIVIPVSDTAFKNLNLIIVNGLDSVYSGTLTESFVSGITFSVCQNNVVFGNGNKNVTRNFVLKNISSKLYEGPVNIIIKDSAKKNIASFPLNVVWTNKPFALMNYEFAIKNLKNIEKEAVVDSLLSFASEKYQKVLFEFWKKYDKTPDTKYNRLLAEFYSRVDYSALNFRTLGNKSGAETDRGKTFIKFGKPNKIDRSSSEKGKIIETWYYDTSGLTFAFVDRLGNGEFTLIKNQ